MRNEMIGEAIEKFFGQDIERIARETGFVERASKLSGLVFLQAMVFGCIEHAVISLAQIAQACLDIDVEISAQGIDNRINENSVSFLRQIFAKAMEFFRHEQPLPFLEQFSHVYLVDSSQIAMPESMAELYPGSGGNGPKASLKIQLVFDFLFGHIEQLVFGPGRENDQGYRGYWSIFKPGALILMD